MRQSRDNCIGRYYCVVCNFCTVLNEGELSDDTVLPYLNMASNGRRFDHSVGAYVDMVSDLHGIVVEVATVRLVGWPHDTPFTNKTVAAKRDDDSMARSRSP